MRFFGLLLLCLIGTLTVSASDASSFEITDPWIRDAPKTARMRSAYAMLANTGSEAIEIVSAHSDDFGIVEMHETRVDANDVSRMIRLPSVRIKAGARFEFKPGGAHLMLMQPKRELGTGDSSVIVLTLKSGETKAVTFNVGGNEIRK